MRSRLRKSLSFILALCMTLTMFSEAAFAAETGSGAGAATETAEGAVQDPAAGDADEISDVTDDKGSSGAAEDTDGEEFPEADSAEDISEDEDGELISDDIAEDTAVSEDTVDEVSEDAVADENYTLTLNANGGVFGNWEDNKTAETKTKTAYESSDYEVYLSSDPDSEDVPLKEGAYVFAGWYTDAACTKPATKGSYDNYYKVTKNNATFYAKYEEAWVVTFDCRSGYYNRSGSLREDTVVYKVKKGDTLYKNNNSYYPGYWDMQNDDTSLFFSGWYLNEARTGDRYQSDNSSDPNYLQNYKPTANTTFYAKWRSSYTVTLNGNGGKWGDAETIQEQVTEKDGYLELDELSTYPVKAHSVVTGWTLDAAGTKEVNNYYRPKDDVTLYAKWSPAWEVTFSAGENGRFPNGSKELVYYVKKGNALNSDYNRPKYPDASYNPVNSNGSAFGGWFTNAEYSGHLYNFDDYTDNGFKPTKDTTFYAKWLDSYKITLSSNGHGFFTNPDPDDSSVVLEKDFFIQKGRRIKDPIEELSRFGLEGYQFTGWYADKECTDLVYARENLVGYMPTADIKLYAGWKDTYTLYFDANGGKITDTSRWASFVDSSNPTKVKASIPKNGRVGGAYPLCVWRETDDDDNFTDHIFTGWYPTSSCNPSERIDDIANYVVSEDNSTLYAGWTEGFKVTLNANGGEIGYSIFPDNRIGYDDEKRIIFVKKGDPVIFRDFEYSGMNYYEYNEGSPIEKQFVGWFKDAECTKPVYLRHFYPTEDTVLYAGWAKKVKITFDGNGGKYSGKATYDSKAVEGYPLDLPYYMECNYGITDYSYYVSHGSFERSGYTLAGWSTSKTGTATSLENIQAREGLKVYAIWRKNGSSGGSSGSYTRVTITFDANGGYFDGKPYVMTKDYENTVGSYAYCYPDPETDEEGMVFAGWWDQPTGGNCYSYGYTGGNPKKVTKDTKKLYAHYKPGWIVTYNFNDGYDETAADRGVLTKRFTAAADGSYTQAMSWRYGLALAGDRVFGGWYLDPECTSVAHVNNAKYKYLYNPSDDQVFDPENNEVTVYAKWMDYNAAEGVTLDETEKTVKYGEKFKLTATVTHASLAKDLVWESDNEAVLVDPEGNVYVRYNSDYPAHVTARVHGWSAVCNIEFSGTGVQVSKVTLNKKELTLNKGVSANLVATVAPTNAKDKSITWESSDTSVATVDGGGTVKAVGGGTCYIYARASNGVSASCKVTVNAPFIALSLAETTLKNGLSVPVSVTVSNGEDDAVISWNSAKPSLVKVEAEDDGKKAVVSAIGDPEGDSETVDVTVTYRSSTETLSKVLKVKVNVLEKLAAPTADVTSANAIKAGDRIHLRSNKADAVIYYTADGSAPAAVSDNKYKGVITVDKSMVAEGKVVIKAFAVKDGYRDSDVAVFTYDFEAEAKASEDASVSQDVGDAARAGAVDDDGYLKDIVWVAGVEDVVYTGKAHTFNLRVYDKNKLLKAGTDYTVKYAYNKNAASANALKAPSVTVTGKGQYKNKLAVTFKIDPADVSGAAFSADSMTLAYAGKPLKPAPVLKWNGKAVANKKNAAYTVEYVSEDGITTLPSITAPGEYTARLTGRGNYTGTIDVGVKVIADAGKLISKAKVTGIAKSYRYTLSSDGTNPVAHTPEPTVKIGSTTLTKGTDYEVGYFDNEEVGTATVVITGKGEYTGEKKVTFKITGNSFKKVVFDTKAKVYTGEEISANAPKAAGVSLIEGTDYDVEYINNIKAGTAKAVYTGLNSYKGAKVTKKFKITPYAINKGRTDIADGVTIESESSTEYAKGGPKSEVTVTYKGEELEKGIDYTVQYKFKKSTGDYYVVVKGKGNFKGTVNPESRGFDSAKAANMRFTAEDKDLEDLEEYATASDKQFKAGKSGSYYYVKPVIKDIDGKALKLNTDYKNLQYTYADYTEMKDGTYKAPGDPVAKTDKIAGPVAYITVTAEGKGHYTGTLSVTYKVFKDALSKVKFTVAPQVYTGRSIQPDLDEITATVGKGAAAKPFTDFEIVSYGVNTKKGKGTIVVRGTGLSGGTKTVKFNIVAKDF